MLKTASILNHLRSLVERPFKDRSSILDRRWTIDDSIAIFKYFVYWDVLFLTKWLVFKKMYDVLSKFMYRLVFVFLSDERKCKMLNCFSIHSLVFTDEILYKTFVLRSIGWRIESLRRVQGLALTLSAVTLQSPNFNHTVPRNVFRPNALTQVQVCKFVVARERFICRSILMARKECKFKLD